jgi:hypothetical protein
MAIARLLLPLSSDGAPYQSENKKAANRHLTGRNRCASVGDFAFERPALDVAFSKSVLGGALLLPSLHEPCQTRSAPVFLLFSVVKLFGLVSLAIGSENHHAAKGIMLHKFRALDGFG